MTQLAHPQRITAPGEIRSIDFDHLPSTIVNSTRSVLWNYEHRNGKATKVPYMPHRPGDRAAVDDPSTWGPFNAARVAFEDRKADGLGIVLGDGLVGIDLDGCRNPETGVISDAALAIVAELNSYTEVSPSGTGLHILLYGTLPVGGRRKGAIEMYAEGRYFTITGHHLADTPLNIEERSSELASLHARIFGTHPSVDVTSPGLTALVPSADACLIDRARSARNGAKFSKLWAGDASDYASHSEADQALCNILAFWTAKDPAQMDRLFRQSGLMRPKWDERRGESTYGERTIENALAHCRETFADSSAHHCGIPAESAELRDATARDVSGSSPEGLSVHAKEPRDSQGTQIVRLAFREGIELFRDEDDTAYIVVPVAEHREVYPLRSKRPRLWLAALFYRETTKAAGSQSIADATNVLEASALQARARPVGVRILRIGDAIYWDLCDEQWRAVEITANGWRVLSHSPVAFKRPKGLQPLPEPARGGSLVDLRPFLNLSDDDDFLWVIAFLLGCLRARKPYPILVVNGEQGSAKSTFTTFVRDLIDPNMAPLRSEPTDARDLMIAASNSFLLSYDNLSHIRLADELSRLSTGAGFSTRRLFENGEEEIFAASRPIILNGIPELATKPDLASRAIFLTLPTINSAGRREEAELCAEFSAARPRILGALLDTVVMALNRSADVTLSKRPRMADFAKWVVAAEPAFPWPEVRFLAVYESNRRGAVEAILDGDVIAATVHNLAPWEGTASALLEQVNRQATEDQRRQRGWFKRPRQVRDALCRLAPALREAGINVIVGQKDNTRNRNRIIRLERGVTASSDASITSRDSTLIQDLSGRATDEAPPASAGSSDDSPYFDGALYGEDDADAHSRAHSDSDGGDDE